MTIVLIIAFILTFPFAFQKTFFDIMVPVTFKYLLYPLASLTGSKKATHWVHFREGKMSLFAIKVWCWKKMCINYLSGTLLRFVWVRFVLMFPFMLADFTLHYVLYSLLNGKNPIQAQREEDAELEKSAAQKERKEAWDQAQGSK